MKTNWKGKHVLVMGLGLHGGGVSVARFFAVQGAQVTVTDLRSRSVLAPSIKKLSRWPIHFVLGRHRREDFINADLVIQNPGVPNNSPFLTIARKHGISIENEAGIFFTQANGRFIGITGTKGKSTVSTLVYEILKKQKPGALLAGNIRTTAMLDIIKRVKKITPVVLELSSWQLEGLTKHQISPPVALITNIYPDHLNRYSSYRSYQEAKAIIFRYQKPTDIIVLNYDNPITRRFDRQARGRVIWFSLQRQTRISWTGAFVSDGVIWYQAGRRRQKIMAVTEIKLSGRHNLENVTAAIALTATLGVPAKIIRSVVQKFRGIAGRLELVKTVNGISFINDTTATSPIAAKTAIEALAGKGPIMLIAGGQDKNLPCHDFIQTVNRRVQAVVLLPGTASLKFIKLLNHIPVYRAKNMTDAVKKAASHAQRGGQVMLSPGAASFNLFKNEFDRGEQFIKAVKKLS